MADKAHIGDLGVTIKAETNVVLEKVKKKTGLTKGMLANIGLAFMSNEIIAGRMRIVDGQIEVQPKPSRAA